MTIQNAGSFGCLLFAQCQDYSGHNYNKSQINLSKILGNNDGKFVWGGHDFHKEASGIELKDEHILVAKLRANNGAMILASVDLNEAITNSDGGLAFTK